MIEIKVEPEQFEKIESILENFPDKFPKAVAFAINRSLTMTRTEQLRRATAMYTVKRGKLAESLKIIKANSNNLTGRVLSTGGMIGANHFKLTPKTRGKNKKTVFLALKRGGGNKLPNAFIAYKDGRLGAFTRKGKNALPIKRIMGLSAPQMLGEMSILEYLQSYAEEKFNSRIDHEIGRILE